LLKKSTRTAMLLGVSALLLLPVLAGCHSSQEDFSSMNRQQQINAMKPNSREIDMGRAMAAKMGHYNPGNTAPTAPATKPAATKP